MSWDLFKIDLSNVAERKANEILKSSNQICKPILVDVVFKLFNNFLHINNINGFDNFYFPETLSQFNVIRVNDDYDNETDDSGYDSENEEYIIENMYLPSIDQAYLETTEIMISYMNDYIDGNDIWCKHQTLLKVNPSTADILVKCNQMTVFDTGLCSVHNGENIKKNIMILPPIII